MRGERSHLCRRSALDLVGAQDGRAKQLPTEVEVVEVEVEEVEVEDVEETDGVDVVLGVEGVQGLEMWR